MDVPEPPRIVFEQPAPCTDGARADDALRRVLAPSSAPRAAWVVTVRVTRDKAILHAEGEITDAHGAPVAHRELDREGRECTALARAMGVWASLVLDAETQRAHDAPAPSPAPAPAGESVDPWPAPAVSESPPPESQMFLAHPENERLLEIGASTFLMTGTGAGMIAGPSLFAVGEMAQGWFLRPGLAVGRTTSELAPSSDVYATFGAARFDACKRLPGNYLERRGIQLDMCGGADVGFVHFDAPSATPPTQGGPTPVAGSARTLPFLALGPSLALRGELGSDLAVTVRGIAELNIVRDSFVDGAGSSVDPALIIGRAEVGISWRVR